MNSTDICECGKQRGEMNKTNWNCNLKFCKIRKINSNNTNNSITKFFKTETRIAGKFLLFMFNIVKIVI